MFSLHCISRIMSWTKSKFKARLSYRSNALWFYSMKYIYLKSFLLIPLVVLELFPRQNMWTNKHKYYGWTEIHKDGRMDKAATIITLFFSMSIKRGPNSSKCDLDLRHYCDLDLRHYCDLDLRHYCVCVVISNIIWKFDEEVLRNGKVIANIKYTKILKNVQIMFKHNIKVCYDDLSHIKFVPLGHTSFKKKSAVYLQSLWSLVVPGYVLL